MVGGRLYARHAGVRPMGRSLRPWEGIAKDPHDLVCLGGCQNHGPFWGVLSKEDIDIDVDIDTDSELGGCRNYSPFLGPKYTTAPSI